VDVVEGSDHHVRLAFHFGPEVKVQLAAAAATITWGSPSRGGSARLELPSELSWTLHRGETNPILGWYSMGLGQREETFTLLGRGNCRPGQTFPTRLSLGDIEQTHSEAM
jgi:hypothetical protein